MIGRDVDPGGDQSVSAQSGVGAVHRVDTVGDPAGASHVLALDTGRGRTGLLLSRLVQRRHDQRLIGQVFGHESAHYSHRLLVVPHRVVEQSLGRIGRGVADVFGDGPAVLTRQVTDQRRDVLPGLGMRSCTGEAGCEPLVQHGQIRCGTVALYDDSRSRLMVFLRHNLMILRRLPSYSGGVHKTLSPAMIPKVRLPY